MPLLGRPAHLTMRTDSLSRTLCGETISCQKYTLDVMDPKHVCRTCLTNAVEYTMLPEDTTVRLRQYLTATRDHNEGHSMESIAEQFVEDPAAPTAAELTAAMLVADYVFARKKFDEAKRKSRLQGRGH